MSAVLTLLAASFTAPAIGQQQADWMFKRFSRARVVQAAAAEVFMTTSPEGKVVACRAGTLIGDTQVAQKICGMVTGMPVDPAMIEGKPAWGLVHTLIRSFQPAEDAGRRIAARQLAPELELFVNTLPKGKDKGLDLVLSARISAEGKILECLGQDADEVKYAEVACGQLSAATHDIVETGSGEHVTYVRSFNAKFSKQETSK